MLSGRNVDLQLPNKAVRVWGANPPNPEKMRKQDFWEMAGTATPRYIATIKHYHILRLS